MPSRAKRTPHKTLLFPVALPLLTLPTTMPLIFAHTYLKQQPVPSAEPNDSSWMNSGKLAERMLLPSTVLSAPPFPCLNSPLPSVISPLPLHLALTHMRRRWGSLGALAPPVGVRCRNFGQNFGQFHII